MTFADDDPGPYVIWSMEHNAWWRGSKIGYCDTLADAGWYARAEALAIVERANLVACHEAMIPINALQSVRPILSHVSRIRPATSISLEVIANLRASVAGGAGHECDEWLDAQGYCVLCGKKGEEPTP